MLTTAPIITEKAWNPQRTSAAMRMVRAIPTATKMPDQARIGNILGEELKEWPKRTVIAQGPAKIKPRAAIQPRSAMPLYACCMRLAIASG